MDLDQLREALAPIVAKKLLQRCGARRLLGDEADQLAHEILSLVLLQLAPLLTTGPNSRPVDKSGENL